MLLICHRIPLYIVSVPNRKVSAQSSQSRETMKGLELVLDQLDVPRLLHVVRCQLDRFDDIRQLSSEAGGRPGDGDITMKVPTMTLCATVPSNAWTTRL